MKTIRVSLIVRVKDNANAFKITEAIADNADSVSNIEIGNIGYEYVEDTAHAN